MGTWAVGNGSGVYTDRLLGIDATTVILSDAGGFTIGERDEGGGRLGGASLDLGGHALDLAVGDFVACLGGVGDGGEG